MYLDIVKLSTLLEKIQKRQKQLLAAGFDYDYFRPKPIIPRSKEEVEELERQIKSNLGHSLPAAYKEFLLWAGRGGLEFMEFTGFYRAHGWEEYRYMRERAKRILRRRAFPKELPDDAIVFFLRPQNFLFFRLSEGEDPPVYCYPPDWYEKLPKEDFGKASESFSKWVEREMEGWTIGLEGMADYMAEKLGIVKPEP